MTCHWHEWNSRRESPYLTAITSTTAAVYSEPPLHSSRRGTSSHPVLPTILQAISSILSMKILMILVESGRDDRSIFKESLHC